MLSTKIWVVFPNKYPLYFMSSRLRLFFLVLKVLFLTLITIFQNCGQQILLHYLYNHHLFVSVHNVYLLIYMHVKKISQFFILINLNPTEIHFRIKKLLQYSFRYTKVKIFLIHFISLFVFFSACFASISQDLFHVPISLDRISYLFDWEETQHIIKMKRMQIKFSKTILLLRMTKKKNIFQWFRGKPTAIFSIKIEVVF